jgi:hypothetical protein
LTERTERTDRTDNSVLDRKTSLNNEMINESLNEIKTKNGPKTVLTPRSLGMSENSYGNTQNNFFFYNFCKNKSK